jgi:methionyl-tRNA synthetase
VDVGEKDPRSVVCNVKDFYKPEQIVGQMGVLLCNLAPADFKGVTSQGLLFVGKTADGKQKALVSPPSSAKVWSRCSLFLVLCRVAFCLLFVCSFLLFVCL